MASTFHLSTPFSQIHPLKPKFNSPNPSLFHFPKLKLKRSHPHPKKFTFTINSVDISNEEDTSESEKPDSEKRRLEEKFAVLNTGIYECRSCGYKYDEGVGDPSYPIPPGFQFEKLPDDWRCPTCGAAKSFFESKSVEIAGFAQNQQYGLGGNSLTSGQKTILIYGTLLFFFALFLSGYFIT
jgi:rubredoxin